MDLRDGAQRGLEVVGLRLLRVEKLDGEEASRDFEERSAREIVLEGGGVEGGAHDDELEVGAVVEDLLDHAENHVGLERSLVDFVENHHVVVLEEGVGEGLAEKHSVGDVSAMVIG